jgi:hypothetical protein
MSKDIQMRALKAWRNPEHEGEVAVGDVFNADEIRVRDLERLGLAERVEGGQEQPPAEEPPAGDATSDEHPAPKRRGK